MNAALDLPLRSARTLLLLDVRTGDPAERQHRVLGFVPFGRVHSPNGRLAGTSFHRLDLRPWPDRWRL